MPDFIILSVKHTAQESAYILMWRPENSGYTFCASEAGRYGEESVRDFLDYYNHGPDIAVPASVVDALALEHPEPGIVDFNKGPVLPNTRSVWRKLMAATIEPPLHPARPKVIYFGRNSNSRCASGRSSNAARTNLVAQSGALHR